MLTFGPITRYASPAAANSAAGIGVPTAKADTPPPERFFCVRSMASLLWAGRVVASTDAPDPLPGTPTPHGSAHPDWRQGSGVLSRCKGDIAMSTRRILTLNPTKARARYHRACARAALFADSSLSVRLRKYNHHAEKARHLEAQEVQS